MGILLFTKLSHEYKYPLKRNLPKITTIVEINQNINTTDLGINEPTSNCVSLRINIKKPIVIVVKVIAWKDATTTLEPTYFITERYKPNLCKSGIAIIGVMMNIHQLG